MKQSATIEFAKRVKAKVDSQGIDAEIGIDDEDSLCIVCAREDENKLLGFINDLKMPTDCTVFVGSDKKSIGFSRRLSEIYDRG